MDLRNPGNMRTRIEMQKAVQLKDNAGGPYTEYVEDFFCWGNIIPNGGQEMFQSDKFETEVDGLVEIRYRTDLTAKHRIKVVSPAGEAWEDDTDYSRDKIVTNNSKKYICTEGHTSSSTTEPGEGDDWQDYWNEFNERILDIDSFFDPDQRRSRLHIPFVEVVE